jgi:hypothetical protein
MIRHVPALLAALFILSWGPVMYASDAGFCAERLLDEPIISVADPRLDGNVNGPSLIRVPDWVPDPLGRYYLYFAHHKGRSIRLAFADHLEGPWRLYEPGALRLENSLFPTDAPREEDLAPAIRAARAAGSDFVYAHIASPDVVVDEEQRSIRMYYHGLMEDGRQATRVAVSRDGLTFDALPQVLGRPYFRVFRFRDVWYALAMPGIIYRSADGLTDFEQGPTLFEPNMRHSAVRLVGTRLQVFWTRVGDAPERILLSIIDLADDWSAWRETDAIEILRPERAWEGADRPLRPSTRGADMQPVNQLRDPAIFENAGQLYLLYSAAGEQAIGIARLSACDEYTESK